MIFAVIDTNVLVSGLMTKNPASPPVRIVEALLLGLFTMVFNDDVMAEYSDVLRRPRLRLDEQDVKSLLAFISAYGLPGKTVASNADFADEDDRVFFELASGHPGAKLVTGNQKHFPRVPTVLSPQEFVQLLGI